MLTIILIGISLSMDAFSLALAYGTLGLSKKSIIKLSCIVGLYHFFMPLLGSLMGNFIQQIINIKSNIIVSIILIFIGINLIMETFKNNEINKNINIKNMLIFGLAVSLDSFSVGIGLELITNKHIICSIIFCALSFMFTMLGLLIGKKSKEIFGQIATLIGGITLIIIGIYYYIN